MQKMINPSVIVLTHSALHPNNISLNCWQKTEEDGEVHQECSTDYHIVQHWRCQAHYSVKRYEKTLSPMLFHNSMGLLFVAIDKVDDESDACEYHSTHGNNIVYRNQWHVIGVCDI